MTKQAIGQYMKYVTGTQKISDICTMYYVGENFIVEVSKCQSSELMRSWMSAGYIPKALPSYLNVYTYYRDEKGNYHGWYNITHKLSEDGKRKILDFDYLREATPENERELVAECIRLMKKGITPLKIQREPIKRHRYAD